MPDAGLCTIFLGRIPEGVLGMAVFSQNSLAGAVQTNIAGFGKDAIYSFDPNAASTPGLIRVALSPIIFKPKCSLLTGFVHFRRNF
jgi:hypothetical protein